MNVAKLNHKVYTQLVECDGEHIITPLNRSVQDDRSLLDGASKAVVRDCFREWVANNFPIERQNQEFASPRAYPITRYRFCVAVDEGSLRSVRNAGEFDTSGYVNIINAELELPDPDQYDSDETGNDDPADEGYEAVEGSRMYDVGSKEYSFTNLAPGMCATLQDGDWTWDIVNKRPPEISCSG